MLKRAPGAKRAQRSMMQSCKFNINSMPQRGSRSCNFKSSMHTIPERPRATAGPKALLQVRWRPVRHSTIACIDMDPSAFASHSINAMRAALTCASTAPSVMSCTVPGTGVPKPCMNRELPCQLNSPILHLQSNSVHSAGAAHSSHNNQAKWCLRLLASPLHRNRALAARGPFK